MKGYLAAEEVTLVHSGTNYFDILEKIIDEAKQSIQFQTYIFETDETGTRVLNALERAALRGVRVYVMVDAFGSVAFSNAKMKALNNGNFHIRKFSRLFSTESIFFGRRLHWKIIVVDKQVSLTGGINVANKYNEVKENAWLDYAVLAKGACCEYLHLLCDAAYRRRSAREMNAWLKTMYLRKYTNKLIGFRINDWLLQRNEIYRSYIKAINNAKETISVVSSYFLPGREFRKALAKATARGVKVTVILTGKSDAPTVRSAELYLYDFYLKNKIAVYEWSDSVMHGKAMTVDKTWATIGSYNINFLSRFISVELNTEVENKEFAVKFAAHLDEIIALGCKQIKPETMQKREGLYFNLKIWLAYNFYRLIMNIFVKEKVGRSKLQVQR